MGQPERLGCGVYADGTVEIGGPKLDDVTKQEGVAFIKTDIETWRKTNAKVEELAAKAGV